MKTAESQSTDTASLFKQVFQSDPEWVSVAPGRVNLIGEHTDYNLLPVLPMTIDRCIRIYGRTRSDAIIRLSNANADFPTVEISISASMEATQAGDWTNYVRAAIQAVAPVISQRGQAVCGFDAIVESDLPCAAGLSSSSALVIAACLAFLHANNVTWGMDEVAEKMRIAEQFVGTAGGGMDQAVISLGRKCSALLIEFDPLDVTPVSLPSSISVFIVNSGQKAEKTGAARLSYNRRALECAIAVHLLKTRYSTKVDTSKWNSLRDVYRTCSETGISWSEVVAHCLPMDPPSLDDLVQSIGESSFRNMCSLHHLSLDIIAEWLPENSFQLYARAAHVLSEASRVYQFRRALEQNNSEAIFHLANASHASCRDLYHISTPGLEKLVSTAQLCGAGAARITGAGFGGSIVAFVPADEAATFTERMIKTGISAADVLEARSAGPALCIPL